MQRICISVDKLNAMGALANGHKLLYYSTFFMCFIYVQLFSCSVFEQRVICLQYAEYNNNS